MYRHSLSFFNSTMYNVCMILNPRAIYAYYDVLFLQFLHGVMYIHKHVNYVYGHTLKCINQSQFVSISSIIAMHKFTLVKLVKMYKICMHIM
jgi:hypothetical protein